jgi:hypothetical protein
MLRCALVFLVVFAVAPKVEAQEAPTLTECEVATASILGQMIPAGLIWALGGWFDRTAEEFGLPDGCERPYLPPETPYCYQDQGRSWCADHLTIWHAGNGFCYFIDGDGWFHCTYPPYA